MKVPIRVRSAFACLPLLLLPLAAAGQEASVTFSLPAVPPVPTPKELAIAVVDGEAAMNNLGQDVNRMPAVRVDDENGIPVKGASVVFTLPADGASGEFRNGSRTLVMTTDGRGLAVAQGLRMNTVAGKIPIHVNASHRGLTARATITQFNVRVPGRSVSSGGGRKGLLLGLVAGAAVGGVMAATRRGAAGAGPGGTATAAQPIGISIGSGTVGPPK